MAARDSAGDRPDEEGRGRQVDGVDRGLLRLLRRIGAALQRIPRRWAWGLPCVAMVLIWVGSSMEGRYSPNSPGIKSYLGNLFHAVEFGTLALVWHLSAPRARGWPRPGLRWTTFIFLAVAGYGALDEFHQSFVPGRDASLWDLATDASGAACVLWIVAYVGAGQAHASGLLGRLVAGSCLCFFCAFFATGAADLVAVMWG